MYWQQKHRCTSQWVLRVKSKQPLYSGMLLACILLHLEDIKFSSQVLPRNFQICAARWNKINVQMWISYENLIGRNEQKLHLFIKSFRRCNQVKIELLNLQNVKIFIFIRLYCYFGNGLKYLLSWWSEIQSWIQ